MATRDIPQVDDIDLPDIPDDEDVDDLDDLSLEQPGGTSALDDEGGAAAPAGPLARILDRLAPLRPIADRAVTATEPLRATIAPYVRIVPPAARIGAGIAVLVAVLGLSITSIARGALATPTPVATPISALTAGALPTRQPSPTPTPVGPSPTPTPVVFVPTSGGWTAVGPPRPNPIHLLPPGHVLLADGGGDIFTLVTRMAVSLRAGGSAPIWGVILSHRTEVDHLRLEFYADSYQRDRPFVGLVETRSGAQKLIGANVPIPELEFWGRDTHEVRIQIIRDQVQLWVDAQPVAPWKIAGGVPPGKRGLYVWGGSKIRFDSLTIS